MEAPKSKLAAIISYLSPIGWIIAYFIRDKECAFTRRHLNQSLIINIVEILSGVLTRLPLLGGALGGIVDIAVLAFFLMGIIRAFKGSSEPLPIIGEIELIS